MVRPSRLVPLSLLIACSASSFDAISTKPKPRERPVSRSVTTLADSTLPHAANASRSRSVDVEKERPPTKSFTAMGSAPCGLPTVHAIPELGRRTGTRPEPAGGFTANRRPHQTGKVYTVINSFIGQFTYLGIFTVLFLGGLGAPIPEELPVLAAGALAHEGYMRWWVAL